MNIFILKRTSTKWAEVNPIDHIKSIKAGIHPFYDETETNNFIECVKSWNLNLSKTYVEFRKALLDIHENNISKTSITSVENISEDFILRETILLPMDDDDLLSPNIKQHLIESFSNPDVDAVTWETVNINFINGSVSLKSGQTTAPGYAVRLGRCSFQSIMWHNIFSQEKVNLKTVHIPLCLGSYIRHPGSTYILKNKKIKVSEIPVVKLQSLPEEAKWCADDIEKIRKLINTFCTIKTSLKKQ